MKIYFRKIIYLFLILPSAFSQDANLYFKEALKTYENYNYKQALHYVDKVINLNPNHKEAYFLRSRLQEKLGSPAEALQDIERYLSLAPGDERAWSFKCLLLHQLERYDEALKSCSKAIELSQNFAEPYRHRSEIYLTLLQLKAAQKDVIKATTLEPDNPYNLLLAIEVSLKDGLIQEAKKLFDKVTKEYSQENSPELLYRMAVIATMLEDYKTAEKLLQKTVSISKDFVGAYLKLAEVYIQKGDYKKALENINKVIKINPASYEAYFLRGKIAERQGNYKKALADYEASISIKPYSLAMIAKASILANDRKYYEAIKLLKQVLQKNPADLVALNNIGNLYVLIGDNRSALKYYNEALKYSPDFYDIKLNKAIVLYSLNEFDKAINIYTELLKENPNDSRVYLLRAKSYIKQRQYDKAEADLKKYEELVENKHREYYNLKAWIYSDKEQYNKMILLLEEALKKFPYDTEFKYNLAYAYTEVGEYENALTLYNNVLVENPNHWRALLNRGILHFNSEDFQKAIEDFSRVIEIKPEFALAYYNRGLVFAATKQKKKACKDFKKAYELGFPEAKQYIKRFCK